MKDKKSPFGSLVLHHRCAQIKVGVAILMLLILAGCGTAMERAARSGDYASVERLIQSGQGADMNRGTSDFAPTSIAAERGDLKMLKLFAEAGAFADPEWRHPLLVAAVSGQREASIYLISQGIDPQKTIEWIEKYPKMTGAASGIRLLQSLQPPDGPRRVEVAATDLQEEARFTKAVQDYQNTAVKPTLPEEARRYKVQAEEMVREKRFEDAAELYGKALNIAPWWPEGHFNRAIVLGENRYYQGAIREMKRYLTLVPNAPDARAAQDKIYAWEIKAGN